MSIIEVLLSTTLILGLSASNESDSNFKVTISLDVRNCNVKLPPISVVVLSRRKLSRKALTVISPNSEEFRIVPSIIMSPLPLPPPPPPPVPPNSISQLPTVKIEMKNIEIIILSRNFLFFGFIFPPGDNCLRLLGYIIPFDICFSLTIYN